MREVRVRDHRLPHVPWLRNARRTEKVTKHLTLVFSSGKVLAVNHRHKFDAKTRVKVAEAGLWQRHDGTCIAILDMPNPYLINALLHALSIGDSTKIITPLAAEVTRRGLEDEAMAIARARTHGR